MTTVLVHNRCPHCTSLAQWMLESIPLRFREDIIFQPQEDLSLTTKVPAILADNDIITGEKNCREFLSRLFPQYTHSDPVPEAPQQKDTPRTVEERFNDLLTQRKPVATNAPDLTAPPRATPSL